MKYLIVYFGITALIVALVAAATALLSLFALGSVGAIASVFYLPYRIFKKKQKKPSHVCELCWSTYEYGDAKEGAYSCGFCDSELTALSMLIPADLYFRENPLPVIERAIQEQREKINSLSRRDYTSRTAYRSALFYRKDGLKNLKKLHAISVAYYANFSRT